MRIIVALLLTAACTTHQHHDPDPEFYGRSWTFTVLGASIEPKKANGQDWDPDLSPPDPFARIYLDGQLLGIAPTIDDTFDPTWNYAPAPQIIFEGSLLSIDLIDSDTFDDDPIFQGCGTALTSATVKAGGASCPSQNGTVDLAITVE